MHNLLHSIAPFQDAGSPAKGQRKDDAETATSQGREIDEGQPACFERKSKTNEAMTTHSSKGKGKHTRFHDSKPKSKKAKAGDERVRQYPASLIERNNTAVLVTGE